ncbi:uncharacterized protein LOC117327434 isoform X2 [Pecten maximus]|uniref:uncharacterized protein LOC117327434 isoform X2 n=1 Tax=Pecten maximus TaxID=6579 RepID=UPI001458C795|nr:uncharacterized protein LOC117327434 isoform X2 [Pecten maximus]
MLKVLCRCYFFFIVNAMIANPRQNANDLDILLEEENGPEKLRIMDINKRFNLDIEERREGIRMKRQVLEECPKGRQQDTVEITCPPETYRQLAEYKCCIYCPEHETGIDCGIASRYGVKIPDGVYAWVMVFVLPVNAAINPFLYTATAVWRRRRQVQTPMTSQIPLQSRPDIARD